MALLEGSFKTATFMRGLPDLAASCYASAPCSHPEIWPMRFRRSPGVTTTTWTFQRMAPIWAVFGFWLGYLVKSPKRDDIGRSSQMCWVERLGSYD